MIKRLLILLVISISLILPATSALAFSPLQKACSGGNTGSASVCQNQSGTNTLYGSGGLIDKIINILSIIIGIIAVFAIVIAGLQFIVSGGDPQKVSTAKNAILFAAIGLVIVGLAQVIEAFVINNIGSSLK